MTDFETLTPDQKDDLIRKLTRERDEERAKTARADGAYIEFSAPGNSTPTRVTRSNDPILVKWRERGETVYYCEWKDGCMVRGVSRNAEACWGLLRRYELANPVKVEAPAKVEPAKREAVTA